MENPRNAENIDRREMIKRLALSVIFCGAESLDNSVKVFQKLLKVLEERMDVETPASAPPPDMVSPEVPQEELSETLLVQWWQELIPLAEYAGNPGKAPSVQYSNVLGGYGGFYCPRSSLEGTKTKEKFLSLCKNNPGVVFVNTRVTQRVEVEFIVKHEFMHSLYEQKNIDVNEHHCLMAKPDGPFDQILKQLYDKYSRGTDTTQEDIHVINSLSRTIEALRPTYLRTCSQK